MNQQSVFQQILVGVVVGSLTVTTFVVILIDEIQGRGIDGTMLSLLSFVMGMASTLLGTHIGGTLKAQGAELNTTPVTATVSAGSNTASLSTGGGALGTTNHTTDGAAS